jgi:GT2 family glycosyltransferase
VKPYAIAVVVCHDATDYRAATLRAVNEQIRPPDFVVIVDTGEIPVEISDLADNQRIIRLPEKTNFKTSIEAALAIAPVPADESNRWLWLLHDDSAPKADALARLLEAVELSPSVAVAGPKQVAWNDQKIITQQGLTLTPLGDLFSLVHGQLDQGQHDHTDDVMAVGTAGALINLAVYKKLGGLDKKAPPLAADVDFSIRVRLAGHRVAVVPAAKVAHASLSLAGKRPRRWLGASPKAALRRAAIHLRLAYSPLPVALVFWLFLPLIGVGRAVWRIASKRPDRIWAEISAALWGFFTLPARLSSRANISKTSQLKFSNLKSLRASWQQVSSNRRAQFEQEQSQATIEAFDRGEFEQLEQASTKGFTASGGLWVMLALTALSFSFWPSNTTAVGGGLLPLGNSWFEIFSRAGASYQPIGLGYFAPSDPFVWVLTLLGSLTFWAPSLSIALLILLAKALAFAGAWRAIALFTQSSLIRTLAALSFALWPSITNANTDGRLPALISQLALPWLVLAVARAANLGNRSLTKTANQTWVWVGLAGLLMAIIGASTPSLLPVLLLALGLIIVFRIRRIGYLIWIPLPVAAISAPTLANYLGATSYLGLTAPMAQLADPGLAQATERVAVWQLLLGGESFGLTLPILGQVSLWLTIPVIGLALLSLITKRFLAATTIWGFALIGLASAWLMQSLRFPALGNGSGFVTSENDWVTGSTAAHLGFVGLAISLLAAIALDQVSVNAARVWLVSLLIALGLMPTAALAATLPSQFEYTDGRVVPSIVAAEAALGSQLKLLSIAPQQLEDSSLRLQAELISGDGVHLEDVSVSYRFALENLQHPARTADELALSKAERFAETKQLVADLASANGSDLGEALTKTGVGYVLVPEGQAGLVNDLSIALDSVKELESVGDTDFGQLWRVLEPNKDLLEAEKNTPSPWSITKVVQLAILLSFILLAIPSGVSRRASKDSSIFVEAGEDN